MRYLLFILFAVFVVSKVINLFLAGKLFEPGALKKSFRESGRTLWQGMQLFVVVWILYLLLIYWVKHR
jgi:hypothetical protein